MTPAETPPFDALLFDLDGTLVEVEMGEFIPAYLEGLAGHFADFAPHGRFAAETRQAIFALLEEGDGRSNEARFLDALEESLGIPGELFAQRVGLFFSDGLERLAPLVRPAPLAGEILAAARATGSRVVLATNPVFPAGAIAARLAWGGLEDFSFDLVTTLENSRCCKPHPGYFEDILAEIGTAPEQALMIGNDTGLDLAAGSAGLATFLLDTWLIERPGEAPPPRFRGGHQELLAFLQGLPEVREN